MSELVNSPISTLTPNLDVDRLLVKIRRRQAEAVASGRMGFSRRPPDNRVLRPDSYKDNQTTTFSRLWMCLEQFRAQVARQSLGMLLAYQKA